MRANERDHDQADNGALARSRLEAAAEERGRDARELGLAVACIETQVAKVPAAALPRLVESLERARARGLARLAREQAFAIARSRRG